MGHLRIPSLFTKHRPGGSWHLTNRDNTMQTRQAALALKGFISRPQALAIASGLAGEESDYFADKIAELAGIITAMPQTYAQDGLGDEALVSLHYFIGGCDWWITEKDAGSAEDSPADFQSQAFGVADIGYGPELGYISLPEILRSGAELDLHFTPRPLRAVKAKRAGNHEPSLVP